MAAKFHENPVFDAALNKVATATRQVVTSAQPANFAGIAAVNLAQRTLTAGAGGVSWSAIADGPVSGRRLPKVAENTISVTATGTATHVIYDDATILLSGTTCTSQALTSGNTVSVPLHNFDLTDPT